MSSEAISAGLTVQLWQSATQNWKYVLGVAIVIALVSEYIVYPFYTSPLASIPGPKLNAMTKWRMVWIDFSGRRTLTIHEWHQKYGRVVRIGPNELAFAGEEPMKTIYGAGTTFYKPAFYNLFIAYGHAGGDLTVVTGSVRCLRYWTIFSTENDERQLPMSMQSLTS
jgi:hypothetical protein